MRTDMSVAERDEARQYLLQLLHDPLVKDLKITFTKTDGTERVMKCTLASSLIPISEQTTGESKRKHSDTVQPVYDLEAGGWRSFRWDSLQSFAFSL